MDDKSNQNSEIPTLTDSQEKVLSLLFVFSGTLSVLGSSIIVFKILKNLKKATPYDRLMLGLSGFDIVASLTYILTPFILPQETSMRVWARGTDGTCTFLGFLSQLSFAAVFYNCMLSFYYLLTVRFGIKRQRFAQRYELWMHAFTIIYFLFTAAIGSVIGVYSEVDVGFGCWVNEYPSGCEETDTCISPQIAWAFGAGPTGVTFLSLVINNIVIYDHVKRRLGSQGLTEKPALATARQQERLTRQQAQIREVATQGFLYVATFFCAYLPAFILKGVEAYGEYPFDETPIYPLLVINSIFLPLQGFFNMFIYNRPNFVRVRAAYPQLSTFLAVRKACFDSDIPKLTEISSCKLSSRRASSATNNNKRQRNKSKTGSGAAFSSGLGIVREVSREDEDSSFAESSEQESTERLIEPNEEQGEPKPNAKFSAQELVTKSSMADSSDDDDDLVLREEFRDVFLESARIVRRVNMDGSIRDVSAEMIE